MQPLYRHFASALTFEYYLHNHFRFCFQLFSWIILSLEHENSNYLWRNKGNLAYQNYTKICFKIWARRRFQPKNFTKSLSKLSAQLMKIVQTQYIRKRCYCHVTAAVKQTTTVSFNAFNNCNTHYNDNFLETVKLLSKSVIGPQKVNKTNKKHFVGRPTSSNLWNRSVSEHIKPVHSTQFHLTKNQNYQCLTTNFTNL